MSSDNRRVSGHLRVNMNVTPLIDVLLVLLIIFMVIAPVVPRGLEAALPQQSAVPNQHPERAIVVQIMSARNGTLSYKINQEHVGFDALGGRLHDLLSVRADRVVFIQSDDNLDFSAVACVMDIGKSAGAAHITLIPSKDRL